MTQKKISRRDAIKLLGAITGATVLANLPSKWSTPELVSGVLPAHAQTSGCPAGQSTMTVFVQGDPGIFVAPSGSFTASGTYTTGYTALFNCQSGCFGMGVTAFPPLTVYALFTVNGSVVFDQTFSSNEHFVNVNGATGDFAIDGNPAGCTLPIKS